MKDKKKLLSMSYNQMYNSFRVKMVCSLYESKNGDDVLWFYNYVADTFIHTVGAMTPDRRNENNKTENNSTRKCHLDKQRK